MNGEGKTLGLSGKMGNQGCQGSLEGTCAGKLKFQEEGRLMREHLPSSGGEEGDPVVKCNPESGGIEKEERKKDTSIGGPAISGKGTISAGHKVFTEEGLKGKSILENWGRRGTPQGPDWENMSGILLGTQLSKKVPGGLNFLRRSFQSGVSK